MKNGGVVFLFGFLALSLWAQNDMHANVNLQFRFANPGARAQAMGGAFIGLADDTTAMFANPGGLALLSKRTLVLELNRSERDNPIPFYGGRIEQIGLQDFRFDLDSRDFPESVNTVPFLGYVHPAGRLKWGLFLAEQANFERRFDTNGVAIPAFEGGRFVTGNVFQFFPPSENRIELNMRSLGLSLAGKLSERLAVGATLNLNSFDYQGNTTLFVPDLEALFPEVNFSPRDLEALRPLIGMPFALIDVDGEDEAVGFFLGLLYTPTDRFRVGLAYKHQPKFDYDFTVRGRDDDFNPIEVERGSAKFNVPDSFGMGFSFQPSDVFLLSVEVNRVLYSQLSDDFKAFFENENDPIGAGQFVDDTTEYRLGVERFFTQLKYPLALRLGYWFEPYHALQNETLDTQVIFRYLNEVGDFVQDARQTVFLRRFEQDQNHVTLGLGLSFGSRFTLDFSGDFAEQNQVYSLSSIYRF